MLVEPRNIEPAVSTLNTAPYSKVKRKLFSNKIPARLAKTTGGTTTENSFPFGSQANVVVTNFYPYYSLRGLEPFDRDDVCNEATVGLILYGVILGSRKL